jgi:signal transduction histidine kinase
MSSDLLRAQAERSRAEAESLAGMIELVAGILAHDLKNPLAAVLMNARLLREAETERESRIGARIVTSAARMSRMIDQVLAWARLREGWIQIARGDGDLGSITEEVVAELRAQWPEAQIAVETRGALGGSWDVDRLAQVVSNLVGNALEHASRPGVAVSLDGEQAEVRLAVSNEGAIDDELLPVIFEPFRGRAAGGTTRGRGLGLGLYMTRQIVLAHGGRVELERGPGRRVTFVVSLPRAPAA